MENGGLLLMMEQTLVMLVLFVGNLDMTFDVSLLGLYTVISLSENG